MFACVRLSPTRWLPDMGYAAEEQNRSVVCTDLGSAGCPQYQARRAKWEHQPWFGEEQARIGATKLHALL